MTNANDYVTGPTEGARLTKREYFAAIAMQGYIASYAGEGISADPDVTSEKAVKYADALINALNHST